MARRRRGSLGRPDRPRRRPSSPSARSDPSRSTPGRAHRNPWWSCRSPRPSPSEACSSANTSSGSRRWARSTCTQALPSVHDACPQPRWKQAIEWKVCVCFLGASWVLSIKYAASKIQLKSSLEAVAAPYQLTRSINVSAAAELEPARDNLKAAAANGPETPFLSTSLCCLWSSHLSASAPGSNLTVPESDNRRIPFRCASSAETEYR